MFRLLAIAAVFAAFAGPVSADIAAQGNGYLVDFMGQASKRADLRISISRDGIDHAFTRWLAREHPDSYRRAVKAASFQHKTSTSACCSEKSCCSDKSCCQTSAQNCCSSSGSCCASCCK